MNRQDIEAIIAEQGRLIFTAEDDRMLPVIRPRDRLVIEAVSRPPKVGDILLCKLDSEQSAPLRIAEISRGSYVMKSDSRPSYKKRIRGKQIIGILTGVIRNGKTFPAETPQEHDSRIESDLIYLLSCAVNGKKPDHIKVEAMDLEEIYYVSRMHVLTSAVAFALEQATPLPHAFDQAKKKAIRKLSLFDIERAAICSELEKAKIRYLPLKGIILKNDYPKIAMREMSDNDILVDPDRMNDVRQIMERLGYTCELYGKYCHDTYTKPPTIEFEMHRTLFEEDETPLLYTYFAAIGSRLLQNGYACRMTDEDFYLYLLCHTYKHYIFSGTGLRSLLDIYVFLKKHPALDTRYLDTELKKLKLTEFEQKARTLAQKVFTGASLSEADIKELKYYFTSGCYGNAENREENKVKRDLGNDDSKTAKRNYLKSRVFLRGKVLEENYPFVAKHKALYPLLLIYRPIKGAVKRPKEIVAEYKKVMRFQKKR